MKTTHKPGFILAALLTLVFALPLMTQAGTEHNVAGYAWSSNIGWVSFNSTNHGQDAGFGVAMDGTGIWSGYAWSPNVGWVSFNEPDLQGCPQGSCFARNESNVLKGWARACAGTASGNCQGVSRTDGWDGWISLSGTGYGPRFDDSDDTYHGFVWGSEVIGWVDFNPGATIGGGTPPGGGASGGCEGCTGGGVHVTGDAGMSASMLAANLATGVTGNQITVEKGRGYSVSWNSTGPSNRTCVVRKEAATISSEKQGTQTTPNTNSNDAGDSIAYNFICTDPNQASDSPTRTVTAAATVNIIAAQPSASPFTINSCAPSKSNARINSDIVWTGDVSPAGSGYLYAWDFSDGDTKPGRQVTKRFSTSGVKSGTLTVAYTDPDGNDYTATCQATVRVSQNPTFIEF